MKVMMTIMCVLQIEDVLEEKRTEAAAKAMIKAALAPSVRDLKHSHRSWFI